MPIDKSLKTCNIKLKKIENNDGYEWFINEEEENVRDEEEKDISDDKKVSHKNNINEHKEYNNDKINKMEIEKEIKVNNDERMDNN